MDLPMRQAISVAALLAPGFEEIEMATPVDILRRAGADLRLLSLAGDGPVAGARGLSVMPEGALEQYGQTPDLVVLPGGMPGAANLAASGAAEALCRRVLAAGGRIGALCAAPALALGAWGLLAGKRVTCHPSHRASLPPEAVPLDVPVVIDSPIITGRDAGAAMAFSLALVSLLLGPEMARKVSQPIGMG